MHSSFHRSPDPLAAAPAAAASPRPLRVGLLGVGVVGSGVQRVLARNRSLIRARTGRDLDLVMVAARDVARARARQLVGPQVEVVGDAMRVVRHPQIDVVVEVIGGCDAARGFVLEAIAQGKHVVTANKALLALHGEEIFAAAQARGVIVAFEGAVAVSIPIVKALREGLAANRIDRVAGILNGTSNYVLSEMRDKGVALHVALREAQRLGYAEADPSLDVEGVDTAHKLALLASLAFGMPPPSVDAFHVEGIMGLQAADQRHAEHLALRIKLLGIARRQDAGIELRVHPALVPAASLMAAVNGSMNGVLVHSDAAGPTLHYGAGAGSEQTASAVVADLIDVARQAAAPPDRRVPALGFQAQAIAPQPLLPIDEAVMRHYLRLPLSVPPAAVLAASLERLACCGMVVDAHREAAHEHGPGGDLVLLTGDTQEAVARQAVQALQGLPGLCGAITRLRIESLA